ncbi:glutaredoxin domain-containing protein [Rhodococcus sp. IEGM 1401]|uniref:glutaredoxin domain-containing protein n=1 Tax=unclassified Rhodococcus (in: high G+C Gram-positive bacteria) TaxID=192944 RepID=UPI0022B5C988|nr:MULTISPECIES: glutaredoxin domain-containing protein [unclassified Rhodococcus (in: high G+C Gram-positive bacteria)]MCZ4564132.1 glutaredoxin domain-containing protein [Rhodococcus sp. IEGM 1401]MDI9924262.1 glutaredoxin domain-containing protein [Rhodococcus sp. IEGM 1372]MDV8036697.1 glutaredoxin domain-containing protein [Rhodococcus sp. IEGM 1414]
MRNAKHFVLAALGSVAGFALVNFGNIASSIVVMVLAVVFVLVLTTPVLYPRSLSDDASRNQATEKSVPLIYWRPGCIFCLRLRVALLLRGKKAVWASIRQDPAAAARVRSVNDGNETVPTVFAGSEHRTNPDSSWVLAQFV